MIILGRLAKSVAAFSILMPLGATPLSADTLQKVLERGKLVVGVKADLPPWGMRDQSGAIVGFEIDMVNDFVERLRAKYRKSITTELVPVVASNRMQFLQEGRIDLMIATMGDTAERRKIVGIVYPNYYSVGVTVFAFKNSGIHDWDSIRDKNICGIQGAVYNKEYGLKNGANMIDFTGVAEVQKALLDRRCVGWLYDTAFVASWASEPEKWKDFGPATPVASSYPSGAAVAKEELSGPLAKDLSEAIIDWHKSGFLIKLEEKWKIPSSGWLADMHAKCLAQDPVCGSVRPPG